MLPLVIPAKAEIPLGDSGKKSGIPVFAGMTR